MSFPERCFRGLTQRNWVRANGTIRQSAFAFERVERDDYMEASIYWEADENAIDFAKNHKSDRYGTIRNVAGLAVVETAELVILEETPPLDGYFTYEKCGKEDNPYHGNLLIKSDAEKDVRQIASVLLSVNARLMPQSNSLNS